jgi:hypothetical protein
MTHWTFVDCEGADDLAHPRAGRTHAFLGGARGGHSVYAAVPGGDGEWKPLAFTNSGTGCLTRFSSLLLSRSPRCPQRPLRRPRCPSPRYAIRKSLITQSIEMLLLILRGYGPPS